MGKSPVPACQDPAPPAYHFLPGVERLVAGPDDDADHDLIVSLDCSDVRRMGSPYQRLATQEPPLSIINIDHHVTNVTFGQLNWVDPCAVATAQMVLELIQVLDIALDAEIATCLLTGIVTDTRGFRTSNTSPQVMRAVTLLMEAGANLASITDQVFRRRPLAALRLWAQALPNTRLADRILWSAITNEMRLQSDYESDGDAGLVSFLGDVTESDMAVVFSERQNGEIDVSMRANAGWDVSKVALALGGGGHPQAAGCTLQTTLDQAIDTVLPALQAAWREQAGH
jgi:phosphoesterase RecJ-like protein